MGKGIHIQRKKKYIYRGDGLGWTRRKGTTDEGEEDSKEEVAWEVDR
jgi:hypothetical protein